jgi:signal transduction histidine kinase
MTTLAELLPGRHSDASMLRRRLLIFTSRLLTEKNALFTAVALALLAVIGDALTTAEATFTLFYVIPIGIVSWFYRLRVAYLIIVVCVTAGVTIDAFFGMGPPSWTYVAWNNAMDFGLFLAFSHAIHLLRKRFDAEVALRRSALDQLRHSERLNTVGRLASGMAHELGTPLNVISGRADLIAKGRVDGAELRESAKIIIVQAGRIEKLVRNMLSFAHRGGTQASKADLLLLCRETAELLAPLAKQKDIELSVRGDSALVLINRTELQQVVSNLVANAVHAMDRGGTVEVTTALVRTRLQDNGDAADRDYALLCVRDQGVGIGAAVLPYIFDPFFTTKDVGEGTGLGLSIVFGIVRDHGGTVRVDSTVGEGTSMFVYLPSA